MAWRTSLTEAVSCMTTGGSMSKATTSTAFTLFSMVMIEILLLLGFESTHPGKRSYPSSRLNSKEMGCPLNDS
jgi:hypothetical protein